MHKSRIVFVINDAVRAIEAKYEDGGNAETFKTLDPTIKVDDLVVVESGTRHGMTVVKVTAVDVEPDLDSQTPVKWAVQRIDVWSFKDILAAETEATETVQAIERRRKKDALREALFKDSEESINSLKLANHSDDDVTE